MRCRIGALAVALAALTIFFLAPVPPFGNLTYSAGAVQEADINGEPTEDSDAPKAPDDKPVPSPDAQPSPPPEPDAVEPDLKELQANVERAKQALQDARDAAMRAKLAQEGLTSAMQQTSAAAQQAINATQQANNSVQLANEAGQRSREAAELAAKSTAQAAVAAKGAETATEEASAAASEATNATKKVTEALDEIGKAQLLLGPTQAMILVVALIILLALLFILLLLWSNRLEQTSYLGELYTDTLEEVEHKRLVARLQERRNFRYEVERDSEWIQSHPKPEEPRPPQSPRGTVGPGSGTGSGLEKLSEEEKKRLDEFNERENEYRIKLQEWREADLKWEDQVDAEAERRFKQEVDRLRSEAKRRTKLASKVDLAALRGRGSEFVLEFTAVVVIIFAAVMLGIIGALDSQQIGTLLAAIAGYVLGRATTRTTKREDAGGEGKASPVGEGEMETVASTPPRSAELAELLRAVAGASAAPDQPPSVSIHEPVLTGNDCAVSNATIVLAGTAKDDKSVAEVQWSNSATQKSGQAILSDGTTSRSWRVQDVDLNPGRNEITVRAKDISGNKSEQAKINVKYTPPEATEPAASVDEPDTEN